MIKGIAELPRVVGRLDREIFHVISSEYPTQRIDFFIKRGAPDTSDATHRRLFEVLQPLYAHLVQVVGKPKTVFVSIDTRRVSALDAQRKAKLWHVDGESGVSASDALPTEFLVPLPRDHVTGEQLRFRQSLLAEQSWAGVLQVKDDALLPEAGLAVFRPQPFEVVALVKHLHRSPANPLRHPISRTWLRMLKA